VKYIHVENPDRDYRLSNIKSTASCNTICGRWQDVTDEKGILTIVSWNRHICHII